MKKEDVSFDVNEPFFIYVEFVVRSLKILFF